MEWTAKDNLTGEDIKITCQKPLLALQISAQPLTTTSSLPLFQISKDEDIPYVPPSLLITRNNLIYDICRNTINVIKVKAGIILDRSEANSRLSEIQLYTLQKIVSQLPPLEAALRSQAFHPLTLFLLMQTIRGSIFCGKSIPKIIDYRHDEGYACFSELLEEITQQLEVLVPTSYNKTKFHRTSNIFKLKLPPATNNKLRIGIEIDSSRSRTKNWLETAIIGYESSIEQLIQRRSIGMERSKITEEELFSQHLVFFDLDAVPEAGRTLVIQAPKETKEMERPQEIYLII